MMTLMKRKRKEPAVGRGEEKRNDGDTSDVEEIEPSTHPPHTPSPPPPTPPLTQRSS
jgi:hypothetical protein